MFLKNAAGDQFHFNVIPEGSELVVIPGEPPFDPSTTDVFRLGLKHSSVGNFLSLLNSGKEYHTSDGMVSARLASGVLHFVFRSSHTDRTFEPPLSQDETAALLEAYGRVLHGGERELPPIPEPGRNHPCPCGSGVKFKKCCQPRRKWWKAPAVLGSLVEGVEDPEVRFLSEWARAFPGAVDRAAYWADLGLALGNVPDHVRALRAFEQATCLDPGNQAWQLNIAVTYSALGDHEKALEIIDGVSPNATRYAVMKANVLQDLGRHTETIPLYERAIAEEPDFFLPYARLIRSLRETGSPLLEYWLERAVEALPHSGWLALEWARFQHAERKFETLASAEWIEELKSETGREDIIGRASDDAGIILEAQAWRSAAAVQIYGDDSRVEEALHRFRALKHVGGACDPGCLLLAAVVERGELVAAEEVFGLLCYDCQKKVGPLPLVRALTLQRTESWERVIDECARVLEDNPTDPRALHLQWWALDELRQVREAIDVAERFRTIVPEDEHIDYNLGLLCGKTGQHARAQHFYEAQVLKPVIHPFALENLAVTYVINAELDRAKGAFERFKQQAERALGEPVDERGEREDYRPESDQYERLRQKCSAFQSLVEYGERSLGSSTYTMDMVRFKQERLPELGSNVALAPIGLTLSELARRIAVGTPSERVEIAAQLHRLAAGDVSPVVARLEPELPCWSLLPEEAKASLVEGERRLVEAGTRDYAPDIVAFAKAFEIVLRKTIFQAYRDLAHIEFDLEHQSRLASDPELEKASKFVAFVVKGAHLELGTMVFALRLATGRTARRLQLLGRFRTFVEGDLRLSACLSKDFITEAETLGRVRNPAAHEGSFGAEECEGARRSSLHLIRQVYQPAADR
jgi:tetratricopeptide (TPR) repeat protein